MRPHERCQRECDGFRLPPQAGIWHESLDLTHHSSIFLTLMISLLAGISALRANVSTPVHTTAKAPNGFSDQITYLASGNLTATPQRDGAGRINGYVWSDGTNTVTQTWTRGPGGRIESAGSDVTGAPSFTYLLDPENLEASFDGSGRRLKCTTAGETWTYVYGAGGQLTTATHPTLGTFAYAFDGIGRRTDKGEANTTDILNQTIAWTHSQNKTLTVKAAPDARVWFNGVEIENFSGTHSAAITPPGAEGGWVPWETLAILEGAGDGAGNPPANPLASPDAKAEKKGAVWVPPTAETLTYDAAGNRESSAQWDFGWDAKNQLTRVRTKNHIASGGSPPAAQGWDITYTYDSEGRRIRKHVIEYLNGTQVSEKIITFVWDGWDLLYERHQLPSGLTLLDRKYLWGPDIADGSAGGAGGLLLIRETKGTATTEIIPLYDGGGNVIALSDINKNLLASYQFGPFGEKISATGPNANSNPWRWATKYFDEETGLYYFGKRYYDPITGQWLSREILGESESINLYSYCHSDPINNVDVLGLAEHGLIYQFFFGIDPITFEPSSKEKERQQKKQQDDLEFIQFLKEFENGQMDTKEFPLEMKMEFVRQQTEMNKFHKKQIEIGKLLDNGIQIRPAKIELPLASQRSLSLGAPSSGVWESNIDFMLPTGAGAAGAKFLFAGMKSLLPVLATGAKIEAGILSAEMRAESLIFSAEKNATTRSLLLPRTLPRLAGTNTLGITTMNGTVYLRPGLSRAAQVNTLRHEGVHAFLSVADNAPMAAFRQKIGIKAYKRSAFMTAAEETLAEGIASGSLRTGLNHAFNGAYRVRGGVVVTPWNAGAEAIGGGVMAGGLIWGSAEFGSWLGGDE